MRRDAARSMIWKGISANLAAKEHWAILGVMTNSGNEDGALQPDNVGGAPGSEMAAPPAPAATAPSASTPTDKVLRRIIAMRQPPKPAPPENLGPDSPTEPAPSAERLVANALGRAAEKLYALPIFVDTIDVTTSSLSELPELLPEQALLAVVSGRRDAVGVVALCPTFLASLIEVQAIGRVSTRPIRPRKPTRTDALISADFVNGLLGELSRELATQTGMPVFSHFGYTSFLDDPRPLMLMLEDTSYSRITMRFRIGAGGKRDGRVVVALPIPDMGMAKPKGTEAPALLSGMPQSAPNVTTAAESPAAETTVQDAAAPSMATLAETVQAAPIHLVGILCRKTMTLGALRNLTPGSLIPLPPGVFEGAQLETRFGQVLARGKLGERDGCHAIRLRLDDIAAGLDDVVTAGINAVDAPSADQHLPQVDVSQPDAFRPPHPDDIPAPVPASSEIVLGGP